MTEFLKDKFSSRPATDKYRKGWDRTFSEGDSSLVLCDLCEDWWCVPCGMHWGNCPCPSPNEAWVCLECGNQCLGTGNCPHCGSAKQ